MSYYLRKISEVTGITDQSDLARREELMCNSIFHSTLDWLSAEQLRQGAWKALTVTRTGANKGYWEPLNSYLEVKE